MGIKAIESEIIGTKHNRLTVLSAFVKNKKTWVNIICECGNKKPLLYYHVKKGATKSCGCICKEGKSGFKHGLAKHPLFLVWTEIKQRCLYDKHIRYSDYGGRGIMICEEWRADFKVFYDWCIENGYEKGKNLTIDRYPNNDGHYEPSNCRVATTTQQQRNKRDNHLLEFNGKKLCITEWSEETGIKRGSIHNRLRLGWPIEKILTQCEKTTKRKKLSL